MRDPSTVYLDATVTLATDVTIEPNVILRGSTSVGEGSVIGAGSQVVDSTIGEGCVVWASVVESSDDRGRGTGRAVQPPPAGIASSGRGAEVGNFAELKNARLGAGVKQHHVSYLGDADLGAGTNVGAGTITANYDGTNEASNDDRGARLPRRRHDAPRPDHRRRRREDRRRRRRDEGRARRASSRSASRLGSASPVQNRRRRTTTPR